MEILQGKELLPYVKQYGRTLYRGPEQALFFNWTNSGVALWFRGKTVMAEFIAMPGAEMDVNPINGETTPRPTWPWLAVVVDQQEVPQRKFEVSQEHSTQLLFHADTEQTHCIRLAKVTENGKGFLGLKALYVDGILLPVPELPEQKKILFIGDSITCGFGNGVNDKNRLFFSEDEDGWMSHGAITARKLGMEETILSSSGIAVTLFPGWFHTWGMDDLYPYTDRILEEKLGLTEFTPWDFSRNRPDYVVLNLGTNDANAIQLMGEAEGMKLHRQRYTAFLKQLRTSCGEKCHIICALGTMDYYLFPEIQAAVAAYQAQTGDNRISCFRYPKMFFLDPIGACGHPHVVTDEKMADAMASYIAQLEC